MVDHETQMPWQAPEWHDETTQWITRELDRRGLALNGQIEQPHVRPWSTVLRVPTAEGDVYFKATAPSLLHESIVTAALCRWRPDCMPPVLAADHDRGWLLLPDLGATLRSRIESPADLYHWERVLPLLADVQIDLADRSAELLAMGALDRRLATLPDQFTRLLADESATRVDQPDGLSRASFQRLQDLAADVTAMCERLAAYGIPESLHHEDFHDANIFTRDGRDVFSDWGEAGVSHPFCTSLVTFRNIAYRLKLDEHGPELRRLCDIYLESWTRFELAGRLREAFDLAYRLGMICRALTWHRVVSGAPEPMREPYLEAAPGWLQEFLESAAH